MGKYEPGLGWEKAEKPKIRVGPLHTADGRDEVMEQLQDALDGGGELLLGGDKPDGQGLLHAADDRGQPRAWTRAWRRRRRSAPCCRCGA